MTTKDKNAEASVAANTPEVTKDTKEAAKPQKKNLNIDLKILVPKAKRIAQRYGKHLPFAVIFSVLVVYLFVVWHIGTLSTAEPSPEDLDTAMESTKVAKIDQKAISQIQSLEKNSSAVHSLFNEARNNPFQE